MLNPPKSRYSTRHRFCKASQHRILSVELTASQRLWPIDLAKKCGVVQTASRDIDTVYQEHLATLNAIERNDADAAEHLARQHVRAAREAIQLQVDQECFDLAGS